VIGAHFAFPSFEETQLIEFSDIKITGIDERRPPVVRKEPYIDLYFKLSEEPPAEWKAIFENLVKRIDPPIHVEAKSGTIITTYVRDMKEIQSQLDVIKKRIVTSNENYRAYVVEKAADDAAKLLKLNQGEGAQAKLNAIVATLNYN
jgi:hypothetical protein